MLQHSTQSGRHSLAERKLDLYATPPVAVEALLAVEKLPHWIWEPAAGRGAIVNVLRDHGHACIASDIVDYGFPLHFVADFLATKKAPVGCQTVLTNPPYRLAAEFARHALDLAPHVYLLLRLAFLESNRRTEILEKRGLARVHVFRRRLPMMHRDGWNGPRASSAIPFAWFCWNRDHRGPTIVDRIALYDIVAAMRPMTVRQVFYQATVRGIVEKAETGYAKVQTDLTLMRRAGELSYQWLADNTRWQRKPNTFDSVEEALQETARLYRKNLWADADSHVEIWLEKDALAGVVYPITSMYDVPLMVARGYASLSFLHNAAEYINELSVPAYIYHLGDFDPSGVNAGEKIEETLREMAPDAEIYFERLAVTEEQISAWNLPSRPTKNTDSRSKNFGSISVELDAIEPNTFRDIVSDAIDEHLPQRQYEVLKAADESERKLVAQLVARVTP